MTDKAVFIDANVLLEILLGRSNDSTARQFLLAQKGELLISALTAHLVVHFGQAIVPLEALKSFLADYTVIALEQADFDWAFTHTADGDFEDALQLSCALSAGCYSFVTFDRALYKTYHKQITNLDIVLL